MEVHPSHIGETLGFGAIRDRIVGLTSSTGGQERAQLIAPVSFDDSSRELAIVSALQAAREAAAPIPEALFDPVDAYVAEVRPEGAYLDPDALLEIRRLCLCAASVRKFLEGSQEKSLIAIGSGIHPIPELARGITTLLEEDGEIKDSASQELRRIRRRMRSAQATVRKTLLHALRRATGEGWATEDQPTIRGGRMVIPVRSEAKRKLGGIVHDLSATGQTAFVEPAECVELNNDVRELQAEESREVVRLLKEVSRLVRLNAEALLENERQLAIFDVRRAKALLAAGFGGILPERGDEGVIDLREARNPELLLIGPGADRRAVVPLTLSLGRDHTMLIISGPNAGGKSVAMKTVGLFVYMLACGIPVPAEPGTRIDRFDRLMGDIGDEQSVEDDLSTFSSRLARMRSMLAAADRRTLVLVDEAGTGTDPQEGAALAQAMLEQLHVAGARVLVTTHHAALKLFAHEAEGALNGMMRFDQASLRPTYAFDAGVPGASYAFEIADRMGLPASVVARGRELLGADHVTMERLLSDLQSRNKDLEDEIQLRANEARKAIEQRRLLESRLEALTTARDRIKDKALDEADRILGGANAQVERAIRQIKEAQANPETVKAVRQELEATKSTVGKARKQTRHRTAARVAPKEKAIAGPVGPGDRVRLGIDGPSGEVIEVKGDEAVVAIGPAHTRVKRSTLTKVGGPKPQQVSVTARVEMAAARMRIDLRGRRVLQAIAETERFVDEAIAGGLNRAEILHGTGTGALRISLQEYLGTREDITSFTEAPADEGGAGVTIVFI
ncbi:MAG: DNA mismatch repair protein MutS2 [Rhodothermales bacterium]|jgi:DNA mismatch repair protein MutS2